MTLARGRSVLMVAAVGLVLTACGSPATGSPGSSTNPGSTTAFVPSVASLPPGQTVQSPAQAAALVFAANPDFAEVLPPEPGSVSHNVTYTSTPVRSGGFSVTVVMGVGDCTSGCTQTHTWNYVVNTDGQVGLINQTGAPLDFVPATPGPGTANLTITLVAGPVCPVQNSSPSASCLPQPVPGAQLTIFSSAGVQVATGTADQSGQVAAALPAGAYYVVAAPASSGTLTPPDPVAFSVVGGSTVAFVLTYDTGIR